MKFDVKNEIIIAGHRGNPAKSKENTIESFKSAIDLKVDMIETDVRLTKDGIAVLMHDDDTFRTTGHKGLVRDMSFNELRKLNAGTEEKPALIPSLEEFLKLCASSPETLMNIEIKVYKHIEGEEMVHQAVEKQCLYVKSTAYAIVLFLTALTHMFLNIFIKNMKENLCCMDIIRMV